MDFTCTGSPSPTCDVKEDWYAAARLEEAQPNELAIAQELPVMSEGRTSSRSIALKQEARAVAKALIVVIMSSTRGAMYERPYSLPLGGFFSGFAFCIAIQY
jgi:hypothetical protein